MIGDILYIFRTNRKFLEGKDIVGKLFLGQQYNIVEAIDLFKQFCR